MLLSLLFARRNTSFCVSPPHLCDFHLSDSRHAKTWTGAAGVASVSTQEEAGPNGRTPGRCGRRCDQGLIPTQTRRQRIVELSATSPGLHQWTCDTLNNV